MTEELAIRLGLKTQGFEDGLQRATQASEEFHKQLRSIFKVAELGGAAGLVFETFEKIIDHAKESKDVTNENVIAVKEYGESWGHVKDTLLDFGVSTLGTFNRIGAGIGDGVQRAGEWLGLWDKSADAVERTEQELRRVTAAHDEAFKHQKEFEEITQKLAQIESDRRTNMLQALTPQERMNQLQNELSALYDKQTAGFETALEARRNELEIAQHLRDIERERAAQEKQQWEDREKADKSDLEVRLSHLSVEDKRKVLTGEIAFIEATIASGALSAQNVEAMTVELKERKLALAKADADSTAEALARRKQIAGTTAEELEFLTLQQKVIQGTATGAEAERLNQVKLQRQERAVMIEMEQLEEKSIAGTLTSAEKDRLLQLSKQKETLDTQIQQKQALIQAAGDHATAEATVTSELQKQAAAAKAEADAEAQARNYAGAGSPLGLHNLGNLSNDVLTAKRQDLQRQMDAIRLEYQQKGYTSDPAADNYYLMSEIQSIDDEMKFRQSITAAYASGGRSGALSQFMRDGRDPLSFDTVMGDMSSWTQGQTQTNQQLDKLNSQIANLSRTVGSIVGGP
jgi:hypothetical protein